MPRTRPERYSDPLRNTRTRGETSRLLGCSINRVDPLIENHVLSAVTIGNRRLITVPSIEKLLGRPINELEAPLREAPRAQAKRQQPKGGRRRNARIAAETPPPAA